MFSIEITLIVFNDNLLKVCYAHAKGPIIVKIIMLTLIQDLIKKMYKINNKGPSTEPCGTPLNTFLQLEYFPLILTRWYLFDKKDSIHDSTLPDIPALRSSKNRSDKMCTVQCYS